MLNIASRSDLASYFATLDASALKPTSLDFNQDLSRLRPSHTALNFDLPLQRGNLPTQIIVRDDDVQDFFAWTSTFVDGLSPLTGFIEVLSVSEFTAKRVGPNLNLRQRNALLGVVLMDGLLQSKARLRIPDSILPAALRTLSAVFYQTIVAGNASHEISDSAASWATIRESIFSPKMPFAIEHILTFFGRIMPLITTSTAVDANDGMTQVIQSYFSANNNTSIWRDTQWEKAFSIDVSELLLQSREERLRLINSRIDQFDERLSIDMRCALGGYMLSLVADGDFALWPTSLTYPQLPTLPLWFAFFTAGSEQSNILSIGQSIGRRLVNLLRFRAIDVDIDAREFLISRRLRPRANTIIDFPLTSFNVLKVRLGFEVAGWFSVREPQSSPPQSRSENARRHAIIEARHAAEYILKTLSPLVHDVRPPSRSESQAASSKSGPLIDVEVESSVGIKSTELATQQESERTLLPLGADSINEHISLPTKRRRKRT